jgi:hypothetical protein
MKRHDFQRNKRNAISRGTRSTQLHPKKARATNGSSKKMTRTAVAQKKSTSVVTPEQLALPFPGPTDSFKVARLRDPGKTRVQ